MIEKTEQEMLAELIEGEYNDEFFDTGSWLAEGLKKNLEDRDIYDESYSIQHKEQENATDSLAYIEKKQSQIISSEKILIKLYELRQKAIDLFSKSGIDTDISNFMIHQIEELGECISFLGGECENFDPYNYVSGLKLPENDSNLQQIINRTKECYGVGEVTHAEIKDSKTIKLVFEGSHKGVTFIASGEIFSNNWTGQEAIDYIYSPNSGKMLVKKYENGKWINISKMYKINWELNEIQSQQDLIEDEEVDIY